MTSGSEKTEIFFGYYSDGKEGGSDGKEGCKDGKEGSKDVAETGTPRLIANTTDQVDYQF